MDVRDRKNLELVGDLVSRYFPEEVETFHRLQRVEQTLDEELLKRQLCLKEVQTIVENKIAPLMHQRRLRLHIFHTFENQSIDTDRWSYVPRDLSRQILTPSWTLRIQGALTSTRGMYQKQHFSEFFSKVVITTADEVVVWEKDPLAPPTDGFELKRVSDKEQMVEITFFLDKSKTELLELPAPLASVTGSAIATVPVVYRALCNYIRTNQLLSEDPSQFVVDAFFADWLEVPVASRQPLALLIQTMRIKFQHSGVFTVKHFIRWEEDNEQGFDVAVEAVDPKVLSDSLPQSAEFQQISRSIADLDKEISEKTSMLRSHIQREAFMRDFAQRPIDSMRALLAGQKIPSASSGGSWLAHIQDVKNGSFYKEAWAVAAANSFLAMQQQKGGN